MRDAKTILTEIANFHPARSPRADCGEEWLEIDALVTELHETNATDAGVVRTLLELFERFPRHDGFEVFWSVLHYLESLPGYESQLISSLQRVPNRMGLIMLRRLSNRGVTCVNGVDLAPLIAAVDATAPAIDFFVDPPKSE